MDINLSNYDNQIMEFNNFLNDDNNIPIFEMSWINISDNSNDDINIPEEPRDYFSNRPSENSSNRTSRLRDSNITNISEKEINNEMEIDNDIEKYEKDNTLIDENDRTDMIDLDNIENNNNDSFENVDINIPKMMNKMIKKRKRTLDPDTEISTMYMKKMLSDSSSLINKRMRIENNFFTNDRDDLLNFIFNIKLENEIQQYNQIDNDIEIDNKNDDRNEIITQQDTEPFNTLYEDIHIENQDIIIDNDDYSYITTESNNIEETRKNLLKQYKDYSEHYKTNEFDFIEYTEDKYNNLDKHYLAKSFYHLLRIINIILLESLNICKNDLNVKQSKPYENITIILKN